MGFLFFGGRGRGRLVGAPGADLVAHARQAAPGGEVEPPTVQLAGQHADAAILVDRTTGEEILSLIDQLNRELGKTILIVTHDPKSAEKARRLIHLEKGVLVH